MTNRQRALQVLEYGSPSALSLVHLDPPPAPGPGEARVRVLASSATLSDSVVRRGMSPYLGHLTPPFVTGYDFAGVVDAVGPGVTGLAVGDRVVDVTRFGANADTVLRPASALTRVDPRADSIVAEVMAMTGITAMQMLTRLARLEEGDAVLVHGASGSVGVLAVALAQRLGAERVVGTSSREKAALVERAGGAPVDRERGDLLERLRAAAPSGFDVIIDSVGGSAVEQLSGLLSARGRIVTFGLSGFARGGALREASLVARVGAAFMEGRQALERLNGTGEPRAFDYDVTTAREARREAYDADLARLLELFAPSDLAPFLSPRPLESAVETHADIDAGRISGRAVFDHTL